MLGFIKNLFGKGPEDTKTPAPTPSAAPAAQPKPATSPGAGAAAAPTATAGEMISVSLKGVVDGLPAELKPFVTAEPSGSAKIKVPLQKVLEGLPKGNVKITYAELKAQAGGGLGGDPSYDQTPVNLPLKEVLSQVKPQMLTMRPGQKTIDIPDDIKPVFGDTGGKPIEPKNAGATAPAPAPAPAAPKPMAAPAPVPAPVVPKPVVPTPAAAPAPTPAPAPKPLEESAPIKPAMGLPDPASLRPTAAPAPKPPTPPATITPPKPAEPKLPVSQPLPASAPAPAPAAPAPLTGNMSVGVEAVFTTWPEDLKGEISKHDLPALNLSLPLEQVDVLMRKGKVLFAWKQLRDWITPALPPSLGSARDAENLELPLKVIIPLFMSARKPGASAQKTIAVDQNIPDVFSGKGVPAKPPTPAPAAPAPAAAPAAPVAAPAAPAPAPAAPTPTGPTELVAKVAAMASVAGVVVASQEGLKIASQLPAEFNGDAFAGFVVAMFSRMNQFTGDLKLGEPKVVSVQTGNRNLAIIRSGRNFLAVIGKPDATLAIDDLKQAAATLS